MPAPRCWTCASRRSPSRVPGDRLTVDGEDYLVQGEPVGDTERLVWTLEAYPAGACPA